MKYTKAICIDIIMLFEYNFVFVLWLQGYAPKFREHGYDNTGLLFGMTDVVFLVPLT